MIVYKLSPLIIMYHVLMLKMHYVENTNFSPGTI